MQPVLHAILRFCSGGFLAGKRTYLAGGLLILQALFDWTVTGESSAVDFAQQLPEILGGMGLMSARAALARVLSKLERIDRQLEAVPASLDQPTSKE